MRRCDRSQLVVVGQADLDIIDVDPSTNISDVHRVVTVIKDGKVYDARAVASEIGVHLGVAKSRG